MTEYSWNGTIEKILEMKDGHTVRIKGVAAHGGETSKNGRHYMREALLRAVNTFIGVPLTVNHNDKEIIGNVEEMDYDEKTDTLHYVADVKKEPYVSLVRQKSPEVKGVSIQADYLRDRCPKCNKEGFLDHASFEGHMAKEHFIRNIKAGPWGIIGRALSLVFGRETPGLNTTVNLAETVCKGFDSLKETVEKKEMERENMTKVAIEKVESIAVGKTSVIAEQKIEPKEEKQTETMKELKVEDRKQPLITEEPKKIVLRELNLSKMKVAEVKKLKLGEPFADYKDFGDCVSKNSDKENPEAYCGSIKHETEGEIWNKERIQELIDQTNKLVDVLNEPIMFPEYKDDVSWKEHLEKHPQDDLSWQTKIGEVEKKMPDIAPLTKRLDELKIPDLAPLTKRLDELKIPDIVPLEKKVAEIKMPDLEPLLKEIAILKDPNWYNNLKPFEEFKKHIEEIVTQQKKDFETILATADKNISEVTKSVEEYRKKAAEFEAKLKEAEDKKLKETTDIKAQVDALKTDTDNLKDKLKPQFKGTTKEKKEEW